jgi:membrane protein implicated in regulation of membrane protease activity
MSGWVYWVVAAVAFAAVEAITTTLFVIPFSAGALAAMVVAAVGGPIVLQLAVFLAASGAAFTVVRPIARRHRTAPPRIRSGTAALIGQQAVVLEDVTADGGSVKLAGEVWSARPYDEDEVHRAGARVHVIQIKGATALVSE